VQGGGHGSEAAGPVVRDVIKAYYDKKAKKTQGQLTASGKGYDSDHGAAAAAVLETRPVVKPVGASVPETARTVSDPPQR
ncbi:MAG: hypothetical protein WA639_03450, partial [Candidatus Acidiferrum sp.]